MTIAELVELLKTLPQDYTALSDYDGIMMQVEKSQVVVVDKSKAVVITGDTPFGDGYL